MLLSRTPRQTEQVRPLYERAVSEGDTVRQLNIELDTLIARAQSALLRPENDADALLHEVQATADAIIEQAAKETVASFTDYHRLVAGAAFASEKVMIPLLFGSNTEEVRQLRARIANGTEGASVELIELLLQAKRTLPESGHIEKEYGEIKGAIQEETAAALLNYHQDGQLIVLPASLNDDIQRHTDLDAYFIGADGRGYHQPISIKSSVDKAAAEKRAYPQLVVFSARDLHNQTFKISKILQRDNAGHPGISDEEQTALDSARTDAYDHFCRQVSKIHSTPMPKQSSELLQQKFGEVA